MNPKTKKRLKVAIWSISGLVVLGIGIFAYVGMVVVSSIGDVAFHTPANKVLLHRVLDPVRQSDYLLMTNGRRADRSWYIYRVPAGSPPTAEMLAQGASGPTLIFNYAESGNHCTDERLEIVADRYLVFWRGGVRHSLFDLDAEEVLFNMRAPWFEYPRKGGERPTPERFHTWAIAAMDQKIDRILQDRLKQHE